MLDVERWAELRREHFVRGVSINELVRRTGLARKIISAGAYVVAVTTVIPSRRLALASSYLSELAGQTAAAHMCLTVRPARFEQRTLHLTGSYPCARLSA